MRVIFIAFASPYPSSALAQRVAPRPAQRQPRGSGAAGYYTAVVTPLVPGVPGAPDTMTTAAAAATTERGKHPRRIIWFCDTDEVAQRPEWLPRLRDEIGLTTLMAEDFTHHTSGFAASPDVAARTPLAGWQQRHELLELHLGKERVARGVYPVVPGILGGVDDSPLRRVLDAAERAGVEVWGHLGLWAYAGEVFPEFALRDVWGQPPDLAYQRWGIGFCPSKRAINEWVAEGLTDVCRRYPVAGFMVDHARYPAPANVWAMFACACADCAAEGRRLGYDVDAIYAAVRELPARLRALTPAQVERAAQAHASFTDWLAWVSGDSASAGGPQALVAWLELRCRLLAERMAEFRTVVRRAQTPGVFPAAARSPELVWGSDVFPPAVALYGGHDYGRWQHGADYLTGGASHGGVVGWATAVTNVALEWGRFVCRQIPGLAPETALRLLYRLLGVDDLIEGMSGAAAGAGDLEGADEGAGGLPLAFEPLERGQVPVVRLMAREVARLVAGAPEILALYPPIAAGRAGERLAGLCRVVAGAGVDGALLSGLRPDDRAQLAALRQGLGALARP
jgi:hypothetical protein